MGEATVRVKILRDVVRDGSVWPKDEVVEVSKELGAEMIEAGEAEIVKEQPERAVRPTRHETATK